MFSFAWMWRRDRPDPEKAVIAEMKKRTDEARDRLNGVAAKVDDAMNKLLDETVPGARRRSK